MFFVGSQTQRNYRNEFFLNDVGDDYFSLRQKTQKMFAWAVAKGYDFVLKTDDDAVVFPQNILSNPDMLARPYFGRMRGPSGHYREKHGRQNGFELYGGGERSFCSGLGYIVNRAAAKIIAEAPDNGDWAEDRFAGQALARAGILPANDPRFIFWPYDLSPTTQRPASLLTDPIVVCQHGYAEGWVERIHRTWKQTGRIPHV